MWIPQRRQKVFSISRKQLLRRLTSVCCSRQRMPVPHRNGQRNTRFGRSSRRIFNRNCRQQAFALRTGPMSSIKRDVKKKVLPRLEGEKILSRDPAHFTVRVPLDLGEKVFFLSFFPFCSKKRDVKKKGFPRLEGGKILSWDSGQFTVRVPL